MTTTRAPATKGSDRWVRRPASSREEFSLQALIELAQDIVGVPNPYKVAELSLMNLMGVMATPLAALWAISEGNEAVRMRQFGVGEAVLRLIEEECLPVLRDDIDPEGAIPIVVSESRDLLGASLQRALLKSKIEIVSLFKVQQVPVALLVAGPPYRGELDGFQFKLLETALCYVSAAMENSHLQAQLTERNRRLRHMGERLGDLDRLKQQFMDNLTHELRTPLTIITGCVDLALNFGEVNEDGREHLSQAMESSRTLDEMVGRMLELRDAQTEMLQVSCRRCELSDFLSDYLADRGPGVAGDLREMVLAPVVKSAVVDVDRRLLGQVIDAIVDNAVKFTPRGTQIEIALDQIAIEDESFAVIRVSDDGPGIPEAMLEQIFDSFRQIDGSATRNVGGMGLGLAYAREVTRAMGGHIEIESEEGAGTTCRVLLPSLTELG